MSICIHGSIEAKCHVCTPTKAWTDVLAERQRQLQVEGWTPEHDDEHSDGAMAVAAACYALADQQPMLAVQTVRLNKLWEWTGWAMEWWKPKDKRRNLVRAGALILAEIERMDRASASAVPCGVPLADGKSFSQGATDGSGTSITKD